MVAIQALLVIGATTTYVLDVLWFRDGVGTHVALWCLVGAMVVREIEQSEFFQRKCNRALNSTETSVAV
jgi:hypothetical protein